MPMLQLVRRAANLARIGDEKDSHVRYCENAAGSILLMSSSDTKFTS
jgi:hypothetical protein